MTEHLFGDVRTYILSGATPGTQTDTCMAAMVWALLQTLELYSLAAKCAWFVMHHDPWDTEVAVGRGETLPRASQMLVPGALVDDGKTAVGTAVAPERTGRLVRPTAASVCSRERHRGGVVWAAFSRGCHCDYLVRRLARVPTRRSDTKWLTSVALTMLS